MSGRFDYVKYDETAQDLQAQFKAGAEMLANAIDRLLPKSRYTALALTHLEITYMMLGKAIKEDQASRGGDTADRPERGE